MKLLIPCGGTRGDTQPCVALAVALRRAGHEVRFFAPTTHVKLCRDQGFETVEFKFDIEAMIEEMLSSKDTAKFGAGLGMLKMSMQVMKKPEVKEMLRSLLPAFWAMAEDFKPDVIVSARPFPVLGICEKLRIPFVIISYQLVAPTDEYPPIFVNDGLPLKWFPSWHKWLGQTVMPLALKKSLRMFNLDDFHKNVLGIKDLAAKNELFVKLYEWAPTLIAAAPEVLRPPKDYGPQLHFTGWWFLDENTDDFVPSPELHDFLEDASRPPVVYLGFGSMKGSDSMSTDLSRMALRALRAAGVRGVLLGGWSGLTRERLGGQPGDDELKAWARDSVLELKAVPHAWLFPRVAAVCHHGGAGTLAAGLRAGRPTVIVPFIADQPYWAAQVEQRGVGRRGPHVSRVTAEALAPLLKDAATSADMQAKAKSVGESIRNRDSLGDAVAYIERFMKTYPYPWTVDCQEGGPAAATQRRREWRVNAVQERCLPCCPRGSIPGYGPAPPGEA